MSYAAVMGGRAVGRAHDLGPVAVRCRGAAHCTRDRHGAFGVYRLRRQGARQQRVLPVAPSAVCRARVAVHGAGAAHAHPLVGEGRAVSAVSRHRHAGIGAGARSRHAGQRQHALGAAGCVQPATVGIHEAVHDSVHRRFIWCGARRNSEFHPGYYHDQPRGRRHRRADAAPAGPRYGGGDLSRGDDAAVSRRCALLALRWCSPPASAAWWCSR